MDARDVIDHYYTYANAGDWDRWSDLFAPDVVVDEQLAGRLEGRETMRKIGNGFPDTFAVFTNQPRHVVVTEDEVAVVSHISARSLAGEPIEAEVANYFRVADGQIAYMANFHDTVPFAPILGG